jgi:5-hydroxyisourate hydrolase
MSKISTHILDTVLGKPAAGVAISLEREGNSGWSELAHGETDADGRCANLATHAEAGIYRITLQTRDYFLRLGRTSIYPAITITFACVDDEHYHLPLLLSDNSYTTYRGS